MSDLREWQLMRQFATSQGVDPAALVNLTQAAWKRFAALAAQWDAMDVSDTLTEEQREKIEKEQAEDRENLLFYSCGGHK